MVRFPQKLLIPAAARTLISRPAQTAHVAGLIGAHRATLLIAPAGWGKTTAVAQWAQDAALAIAWYTIDATDRDPYMFVAYLLDAVAPFVPAAAQQAQRLQHTRPHELPAFLTECAALIAAAEEPFALVLDDLHLLTETDEGERAEQAMLLAEFLGTLIDYATSCHLVILSRTLPRRIPGLIRLLAQRRVAVLDYLALQWGADEIRQLAAGDASLDVSQARALADRFNGWPMGIVLALDYAASAAAGGPAPLLGADTDHIYDYFAEQIIAPLSPALQRFLEESSVLDHLSVARCNTLCRRDDAAVLLDELVARGLFLSRRGGWLSYHSLFRDFLRARLARDASRERELLRRAGELYAAEDDLAQAVACYCAAGERQLAFDVVRSATPRLRQRAMHAVLIQCFEMLQQPVERGRGATHLPPDLLIAQARVYGDMALWERAYVALQQVEALGEPQHRDEARLLEAEQLTIQGSLGSARATLLSVPPNEQLPPRLRLDAYRVAGRLAILEGQLDAGTALLSQALAEAAAADEAQRPEALAMVYDLLGYGHAAQGESAEALRCLQRADAYWQISGNSARRAVTLNNVGWVALEAGRRADARSALTTALALAQETARRREELIVRLSLAELELAEGNLEECAAQSSAGHAVARQAQLYLEEASAASRAAWATALGGSPAAARRWLQAIPAEARLPPAQRASLALLQAWLRMLQQPSSAELAPQLRAVVAARDSLASFERAALALLEAHVRLAQGPAAVEWAALDAALADLSEPLLRHLTAAHQPLLAAAPAGLELVRRLGAQPGPAEAQRWQIRALGRAACTAAGQACELTPMLLALLVRLLEAGPGGLTVERLWEDVWGEAALSMPALHKMLSRLREQTGLATVARGGHCRIHSDWDQIAYDVQAFERALAEPPGVAALERAVGCYDGDFLPVAPASALAWAEGRRIYLQQRYLAAMEQLAQLHEEAAPERAVSLYETIFQLDHRREQTAARLMALAGRLGNHNLVNATFARLSEALQALGLTPLPSTVSLARRAG